MQIWSKSMRIHVNERISIQIHGHTVHKTVKRGQAALGQAVVYKCTLSRKAVGPGQ